MKAWYFSTEDKRLQYGDGRLIKPGVTHKVDCDPVPCEVGLHGSQNIIDALRYAPGPIVWRVQLGGKIVKTDNKAVATERTYLWGLDATPHLKKFARLCALDVIHLWDAPNVVRRFLKTGDESIRVAAKAVARAAASFTVAHDAYAASGTAYWALSESAAEAAAWGAARTASRTVPWAASRTVPWNAVREKQNRRLYRMIIKANR